MSKMSVVGKISQRIIDLTTEQLLAVIKASDSLFIGNEHSRRLSEFLYLRKSYKSKISKFSFNCGLFILSGPKSNKT